MLLGLNISLFILGAIVIVLTFLVTRIFRMLRDFALSPSLQNHRARKRFLFDLESRIRAEANAAGDTGAFATRLLDMIAEHHKEMDVLDQKQTEETLNKFRGKAAK